MKNLLRTLRLIARLEPSLLPVSLVTLAARNIAPYITTLLSAYVLDALLEGRAMREIIPTVIWALLLRLLLVAVGEITEQMTLAGSRRVHGLFMAEKSRKTLSMDFEELNSPKNGELRGRINDDDMYGWGITDVYWTFTGALGSLISMITALVIVLPMISVRGGSVIYLAAIAAAIVVCAAVNGKIAKKQQESRDSYQSCRSYSSYYLWGRGVDYKCGKDIRIYSAQPLLNAAVSEDAAERRGRQRFISISRFSGAFNGAFGAILQGSSYIYVAINAVLGNLGAGSAVKFASSLYGFWGSLSGFVSDIAWIRQCSERFGETLDFLEIKDRESGSRELEEATDYTVEFKNVSFKYPGSEKYVLKNVSARLKTGERCAIVGLNGSGKTTFIKLLCRLYHPSEGVILLNGVDIEEYSFESYVKALAVVFQNFRLFSFTLGENVAASEEYDEEKVKKALGAALFGERLASLENGLKSVLYKDFEDGIDISGGEAQKIALARALYKNAPFMILDEPTAALDPLAEFEIYSMFNAFTDGKCAIYISHRLSSCVFCDKILVFDDGRIVQRGPHEAQAYMNELHARLTWLYVDLEQAKERYAENPDEGLGAEISEKEAKISEIERELAAMGANILSQKEVEEMFAALDAE